MLELKHSNKNGITRLKKGKVRIKSTIGNDLTLNVREYREYKKKSREIAKRYAEREKREQKDPRERTLQLLYHAYNKEIEGIVSGSKKYLVPEFDKIRITEEALNKIHLIARRTEALIPGNEIYLYLLNYKEKRESGDNAVRDVYIGKDQKVTPTSCDPSGEGDLKSIKDIVNQGKYRIGWAHSHGHSSPFHSSKDKRNLNCITSEGTKIDLAPKPFSCSNTNFRFRYSASIVVNAKNDKPSLAIGIEYTKLRLKDNSRRAFYMNENPEIEIIEENNNIEQKQSVIDREILERTGYKTKGETTKETKDPLDMKVSERIYETIGLDKTIDDLSRDEKIKEDLKKMKGWFRNSKWIEKEEIIVQKKYEDNLKSYGKIKKFFTKRFWGDFITKEEKIDYSKEIKSLEKAYETKFQIQEKRIKSLEEKIKELGLSISNERKDYF